MPLASSCSMRWNRRSEPLRSTRTEIFEYFVSKPLATFSATGKSTDVYQTTLPSLSAAAIRPGPIAVEGTASASEKRGVTEPIAMPAAPFKTVLRVSSLRICKAYTINSDILSLPRFCPVPTMWAPNVPVPGAASFSSHDTVYGEVEDVEIFQATARGSCCVSLVQRIIQDKGDATLGDTTVGSQRMAVDSGKVVRRGRCSNAGLGIADDHKVAFTIDRQIEPTSGSGLAINGFDTREPTGELHHGFGCCATVTRDAHKAAERTMMRDEIVGNRADHCG